LSFVDLQGGALPRTVIAHNNHADGPQFHWLGWRR
jgi:hypothetical protein